MFDWLFNKNSKKTIVKKAIHQAKKLLRSRQAPGLDVKVDYLFWYGAVEIDPKHCVVWIMLRGKVGELADGEVRGCGWEWETPKIGVESTERVKRGGFNYFR